MDESAILSDESEEEKLREMERAIDDFLFSIRENVTQSSDIQNEGACSKVDDEYDIVSSDDCFENEIISSRKDRQGIPDCIRKLPHKPCKSKHRMRKGNMKNYGRAKLGINYSHERWHRHNDRKFGQSSRDEHFYQEPSPSRCQDESFSPSSNELYQERSHSPQSDYERGRSFSPSGRKEHKGVRRVSPKREANYSQQREFIPRERHGYTRTLYQEQMEESLSPPRCREDSFSPSIDEFQQERNRSPRSDYDRGQSFSPSGRKGVRRVSPDRKGNCPQQREFIPRGRHKYRRRKFCQEEVDECSQDSYVFEERNYPPERPYASRSISNDGNTRRRELSRGSNSPIDWSESYDYDSDYEDQHSNQSWRFEENHLSMEEDRNGQSAASLVTAILQKAIAQNPDIATKVTKACLAMINQPSNGPDESDYECDRDSWAAYKESGRVSPQSWQGSRSPSFTESLDALSSRSGFSRHSNRFHGHSSRSVLERSISPDNRQTVWDKNSYLDSREKARYSPDYKRQDDTRSSAAVSGAQRPRKRSSSEHSKNHHEEEFDLKEAVSWSIRKIRKQCRREKSSVVRRALLSLLEVHEKECKMYMKKPDAHPDYNKEYRDLVDQKIKSIVDLGGDPKSYDFEQDWRKHWPVQMYKLFQESWNTKMHNCTSMLQQKCGFGSKSSSRKSSTKHSHEKRRTHKQESEEETVEMEKVENSKTKRKFSEVTQSASLEDQQMLCKNQEEMNNEIFSILKLLNHIKHRFNDCESSFDRLYVKALSLKEDGVAIYDILQGDLPLLRKIDEKLKETLEEAELTLIQKAIIQETHERFRSFLKTSKDINSHSTENKGLKIRKKVVESMDTTMKGTGEHQIPCHLTNSYAAVVSSNCGTSQQVVQSRRTIIEISPWGSSASGSSGLFTPENIHVASFLPSFSQDGILSNMKFTPDVMIVENNTNQPVRTLTEISLVGSSSTLSSVTHKHNVIVADKDSDMTQPPPPGVTPPPSGLTFSPLGLTPPPLGVTPPPPGVSSPPLGVTPPSGVTPPPSSETPTFSCKIPSSDTTSPSDIPASSHGETLKLPDVTHQLPDVTPLCSGASTSCIKPPPLGSTPSNSVTKSHCRVSAPSPSVAATSHSVTTVPCCVTQTSDVTRSSHSVNPQSFSSTSDVTLLPTTSVSLSSVLTHSQAPVKESLSLTPAASGLKSHSANDETPKTSQHLSLVITPTEKNCVPTKHVVTGTASKTDTPRPSKELLRSTIKDCFLSSSLPEENNVCVSKKEEPLRMGTSSEESSIASVPSLSEEILKMFEIKPVNNDRIKSDETGTTKMDNAVSSGIKSTAKKPIKITIPQFSKQKRMPEFNPISDDQELL